MLGVMARSFLNKDIWTVVEPFRPVIDGEEYKDQPLNLFRDGMWQKYKSFIIGTNTEETYILKYFNPTSFKISNATVYVSIKISNTDSPLTDTI